MKQTYLLTNLSTGDEYIGVTGDNRGISMRMVKHKSRAKKGKHNHLPLYQSINKYGWDNFTGRVLCEGNEEEYYCWLLQPTLNQCWVGEKPISQKQVEATRKSRIVAVRDKKTGIEYSSMKEARAATGVQESSISRALRNPTHRWERVYTK